jgi:hypothetical protein
VLAQQYLLEIFRYIFPCHAYDGRKMVIYKYCMSQNKSIPLQK